ncbi:gluconeogenesis factor YvcK family protein [Auritidibacter ignavus]|uniref:gluconeogenesis factor YvcK family protein n=1 Tax=Auritidibacter ignavus TaxID=678932 RepID=UPI0024481AE1|nr:uridine diphosphate-N-acetylglucosamine-binding protein YvcK [Auritidibacter ignavus]WGH84331.1 uridine diphosphate-N-acetylglucosamine-binding protein YvcK [Auritidibacter ignavus]
MSVHYTGQLPLTPSRSNAARKSGHHAPALKVTALGGGHGLYSTLSALRLIAGELTAVVTVADDGGSSGVIRQELDVIPPGDLRMALAALCDDTDWGRTWRDTMQHRFITQRADGTPGTLNNHALGNLLIVALGELLGDSVAGLQWAGALLGARGTVLPMSRVPLTISGTVLSGNDQGELLRETITGQAELARAAAAGSVVSIRLDPDTASATPEALEAIDLSDWVVLGPGSWFTSVLPHLLLPQLRNALIQTTAQRALVMNLQPNTTETNNMCAADHLEVLHQYAPQLRFDAIIVDHSVVDDADRDQFEQTAEKLGAEAVFSRVLDDQRDGIHDPLKLAVAFDEIFSRFS